MSRRKTPEDYQSLAAERGFEWLGPPVQNTHAKTGWRCDMEHEWKANYNNIQQGRGCPNCGGSTPKTPEDYQALAAERGFEWLGPPVQNAHAKTGWRCDRGHDWKANYSKIQQGRGCPNCAGCVPKTPDDYHALAAKRSFEWLGQELPQSVRTPTRWCCKTCGHEWKANYNSIHQGRGCPNCAGKAPKTPDDYHALAAERGFEWLGPIAKNVSTKTGWLCDKGHKWMTRYDHIQWGSGCPNCTQSRGEEAIAATLEAIGLPFRRQQSFNGCRSHKGHRLRFDFYLIYASVAILIEYDGRQHFEPVDCFGGVKGFKKRQRHDSIKGEFAEDHSYMLIRVPYTVNDISKYVIEAIAKAAGQTLENVLANMKKPRRKLKFDFNYRFSVGVQLWLPF